MLDGKPPYFDREQSEALSLIANIGTPFIPKIEVLSWEFKHYLSECLQVDARKRPHAKRLLEVSSRLLFPIYPKATTFKTI
jgi:serine/threonine protein kinase